jgi:predicted TIM-barrel fold metal-dependent hydrolase
VISNVSQEQVLNRIEMESSSKKGIKNMLRYLEDNQHDLVIDADTHITDTGSLKGDIKARHLASENYYHGKVIAAEDLLMEMKMAGVDMSLTWQNPASIRYGADEDENFEMLLAANRYILDSFLKYPDKFIPAGWTDPKALGVHNAVKLIRVLMKDFGFMIVKMNPAQNAFPMYSADVVRCVEEIMQLGGIPAVHYGADTPYTPPEDLKKIAALDPDRPVLAVHMGGGGAGYVEAEETYLKTRKLGLEMPNIRFILSAKRDTHIESDLITYQLAGAPFKHNIYCASDAPYGRQTWNFGGYERMFRSLINGHEHSDRRLQMNPDLFKEEDVKNYLGGNFARFVLDWYERFLSKQ